MKKLVKKLIARILVFTIVFGAFSAFKTGESYAATSYLKRLKLDTTYYYNIDSGSKKEKIRVKKVRTYDSGSYKYKLKLYINDKYATQVKIYNVYGDEYAYIYDFYKYDTSKEIYLVGDDYSKIVKYKSSGVTIKSISGGLEMPSYTPSTGKVKIYRNLDDEVLMSCISTYTVKGYKITKSYINTGINPDMLTVGYKALKTIKAYKSPNSSTVAFTIRPGDIVYAKATYYKSSSCKYIKFEKGLYTGKFGWVKVSSTSKVPSTMFKNVGYSMN